MKIMVLHMVTTSTVIEKVVQTYDDVDNNVSSVSSVGANELFLCFFHPYVHPHQLKKFLLLVHVSIARQRPESPFSAVQSLNFT